MRFISFTANFLLGALESHSPFQLLYFLFGLLLPTPLRLSRLKCSTSLVTRFSQFFSLSFRFRGETSLRLNPFVPNRLDPALFLDLSFQPPDAGGTQQNEANGCPPPK